MDSFSEKMKNIEKLTDLELLDFYVEECYAFIDPRIFRHVNARGLYHIIDIGKTGSKAEMKAIIRAKLHLAGRYTGDPEIEAIAAVIYRIKTTQAEIFHLDPTDGYAMKSLAERMAGLADQLINFYE